MGVEGTRNRSNSRRPEYDALSLRAQVTYPLPWSVIADAFVVATGKSYLFETEFVRLVPGEEADNASQAYLTLSRAVAANLDAALQFGWTRAETDVGEQYYERYGVTVLFRTARAAADRAQARCRATHSLRRATTVSLPTPGRVGSRGR